MLPRSRNLSMLLKTNEFYDIPHEGNFPANGHVIIGQTLANRLGKNIDDELTLLSPIDQVFGLGFIPMKKMKISVLLMNLNLTLLH